MKNKFLSKAVPRGTRTIWRYLGALFLLFTFAIGNVWAADETFTFSWSTAGVTGYCYNQAGPTNGALITNNAVYFISSSTDNSSKAPTVETISSKAYLNPQKTGFVFKPVSDVTLSVLVQTNNASRTCTIYVDSVSDNYAYAMYSGAGSASQKQDMCAYILANAANDTEKQWWLDGTNGKSIKQSNNTYAAGTDGGAKKWLSGEQDPGKINGFVKRLGSSITSDLTGSAERTLSVKTGTDPFVFKAGKVYRVNFLFSSNTKQALKSFTFAPVSSTLTLNPNEGTFDTEGWTNNNNGTWSKTVTNGNVTLPTVTKEHYHGGWNVSGNTVTSVNVSANTTVSADWAIDTYTVNFLNKDASVFNTVENVAWNTTVSAPASDPTADGFNFDGWDFDFTTAITANTNIASKWLDAGVTYHTVTLNYDNGSANGSESVEDGTAFVQPANPSKEGHTFSKWVLDDGENETDYDFSANVTADITLKAVYTINKYTVNFLNQDASVFSTVENVEWNTTVAAPTSNPSVDHYTFNGWDFDLAAPITANTNIASLWTAEQEALTFNSNGGSAVANQSVDYNSVIAAPVSTRTGWTLQGWTLNPSAEPVALYDFSTPITSDLAFTAVWSRNAVSSSSYDVTLSNGTNLVGTYNEGGVSIDLSAAIGTGSKNTSNGGIKFNYGINSSSSGTNYIQFTIPSGYSASVKTLTLNGSNEVIIVDALGSNGETVYSSTGTPNGTFTAGNTYYMGRASSSEVVTLSVLTLTEAPIYVTFMNGETQVAKIQANKNETLGNLFLNGELPTLPNVTGYTFNGWKNGTTAVDKNTAISASMTLTADWALNSHTLTWDFAEGATTATVGTDYTAGGEVAYGTAITYPSVNTMSRELYDFAGWSTSVTSMPDEDLTITAQWTPEKTKHNITYVDIKGADNSANPIKYAEETGVASFAPLADVEGWHFVGWSPASIASTATTDQTITAQWVPTFTVTYDLGYTTSEEAPTEGIKLEGAEFTLAAAPSREYFTFVGWLCSANNDIKEASVAYTMTAANTTFTAQWLPVEELSDIYVWSKSTSYGGDDKCISSSAANANDPTHLHTSVAYSGFTKMGRASDDNTECELTISVTRAGYGIKSICTYGKFEESAGGSISWDGGTNWIPLAKYTTQKDTTFVAPDGTYPTSFKIKFFGVSSGSGGLWWRNALVTIEAKKTITGTAEELVGAKINGTALTDAEFAGLFSGKSFNDANTYGVAPTVTFVKQVTTSYEGLWPDLVENVEVPVVASDELTYWEAVGTVNSIDYTVTLAMPTDPMLETETTALTLMSATDGTDSKTFKFSGRNLENNVTISLASTVEGMTINPTEVSPDANGRIIDQEITVSYASLVDVAEENVVLTVAYSETVKKEIALTYSSTKGYAELVDVTGDFTWDFSKATASDVSISNTVKILANYGVNNDPSTIVTDNIEAKGEKFNKNSNVRVNYLHFHTTVPGRLTLEYSNTGGNNARTIYVNGGLYDKNGSSNNTKKTDLASVYVPAGDVVLEMEEMLTGDAKNVQLYKMIFTASNLTPDYTRDVTEGRYGTICLPNGGYMFGTAIFEIAYMDYVNNQPYKIYFDEVLNGKMEAGMPYIFLPNEAATQLEVFYSDSAAVAARHYHGLYGSYTKELLAQNAGNYILKNNQYYLVNSDLVYVGENRAYIYLAEVPNYNPGQPANGRRRVSMNVNAEQTTTDLENLSAGEQPMKMVIDGKLFILRGEKLFDATGRLVK